MRSLCQCGSDVTSIASPIYVRLCVRSWQPITVKPMRCALPCFPVDRKGVANSHCLGSESTLHGHLEDTIERELQLVVGDLQLACLLDWDEGTKGRAERATSRAARSRKGVRLIGSRLPCSRKICTCRSCGGATLLSRK